MPIPGKPWWEWTLFAFAVLGAVKSFLWDWLISPLLKRPKLVGEITDFRLVRAGPARNEGSTSQETFFDSEFRLRVSVHNKRPQSTYLKEWVLEVRPRGGGKVPLSPFTPEQDRRWRIPEPPMPERIHFSWREPHEGWLYFLCPNRSPRSLEFSKCSLFAVDTDGRKHRLGVRVIDRNVLVRPRRVEGAS